MSNEKVTKVQMTMTLEQSRILMRAMDMYMRVLMGQFWIIEEEFDWSGNEAAKHGRDKLPGYVREEFRTALEDAKRMVYPNLGRGVSLGITGDPCPRKATMIYDMYKVIDNKTSWHSHPEGGIGVNFDKPMQWLKAVPLPEVKVFEE
jgi:hypothetical protein